MLLTHDLPLGSEDPAPLPMSILSPLLAMQTLETLLIEHPTPPNLRDDELECFAMRFPELRHFSLCARAHGTLPDNVPTMASLIPFAQHCRKLVSIGIYMDASVPVPVLGHYPLTFAPSLEAVHVLCSKIDDDHAVVSFLASILPVTTKLHHKGIPSFLTRMIESEEELEGLEQDVLDVMRLETRKYWRKWYEVAEMLNNLSELHELIAF